LEREGLRQQDSGEAFKRFYRAIHIETSASHRCLPGLQVHSVTQQHDDTESLASRHSGQWVLLIENASMQDYITWALISYWKPNEIARTEQALDEGDLSVGLKIEWWCVYFRGQAGPFPSITQDLAENSLPSVRSMGLG
jgi:hypothetical protein